MVKDLINLKDAIEIEDINMEKAERKTIKLIDKKKIEENFFIF